MAYGDELSAQGGNAPETSSDDAEGQSTVAPVPEQAATASAATPDENFRRYQSVMDRRIAQVERDLHMTRAERDSLKEAYDKAVESGSISSEDVLKARFDRLERALLGPNKPEPATVARVQTAMDLADSLGIDPARVRGYQENPELFIASVKGAAKWIQSLARRQGRQAEQRKAAGSPAYRNVESSVPSGAGGRWTRQRLIDVAASGEYDKYRQEIDAAYSRGEIQ